MNTYFHAQLTKGTSLLSPEEGLHCTRVHRTRIGTPIELIDGRGHRAKAVLEDISKNNEVRVCIEEIVTETRTWAERSWLCIAPTKQIDRIEWFLEKAVEIGIGRISFFHSEYSERRTLRIDRLEKIALAALKQCRGSWLPQLDEILPYTALLSAPLPAPYTNAIAHFSPNRQIPLKDCSAQSAHPVRIFIGPEGGFSETEYTAALTKGYCSVSIGERRLRTETAALVATFTLAFSEKT